MERLNFSDNIHVTGRKFHLQTCTDDDMQLCMTLFESGKVLAKNCSPMDINRDDQDLHSQVYKKHKRILNAIIQLFDLLDDLSNMQKPTILLKMIQFFIQWQLWKESNRVLKHLLSIDFELYPNSKKEIFRLFQLCELQKFNECMLLIDKIKNHILADKHV